MAVVQVQPVVNVDVRTLCRHPYPNHPHGCPNWGKKHGCPPKCPLIGERLNLRKPVFAIYNVFDFGAHVAKMRGLHPAWSKRQVECCLYWQGTARKRLKGFISEFIATHHGFHVVATPEAQGVDLTATMKNVGIELEWPPVTKTYQIVLAGTPARLF